MIQFSILKIQYSFKFVRILILFTFCSNVLFDFFPIFVSFSPKWPFCSINTNSYLHKRFLTKNNSWPHAGIFAAIYCPIPFGAQYRKSNCTSFSRGQSKKGASLQSFQANPARGQFLWGRMQSKKYPWWYFLHWMQEKIAKATRTCWILKYSWLRSIGTYPRATWKP